MSDQFPTVVQHDRLLPAVGKSYFPLALAARLPYAMMVVGVLTLVVAGRGSITLGGLNSAVVGLGTALVGPLIGAAVDRLGQRPVLLVSGLVNGVALLAMAWVVFSPLPDWCMLVVAFVIGAAAPQIGPMSRTRLVGVIGRAIVPARRSSVFHGTMSYESAADEVVFVFGPVLVGVLATGVHPVAPVIGAAVLTGVFVITFALHPSATLVPTRAGSSALPAQAPARELLRAQLIIVVVGVLGVGMIFGSVLTSLTAYMDDRGQPGQAGLLYGALGLGSAVLALAASRFPPRFTLRARLLVFGTVLAAATLLLGSASGIPLVLVALAVAGIGLGPILVTQFSLGSLRSPRGRSATVMTMLGSAIMVGQAGSSALTGWAADSVGTDVALWFPTIAAAVVLLSALVNWRLSASDE